MARVVLLKAEPQEQAVAQAHPEVEHQVAAVVLVAVPRGRARVANRAGRRRIGRAK